MQYGCSGPDGGRRTFGRVGHNEEFARSQVEAPSTSKGIDLVFPGVQWEAANPAELGWSIQGLANAYQAFATLTPASMVVIDRGRIVIAWGDIARRVKVSSVRKSLLSALYGTPVRDERIKLDDTLEKLEIDDDPPLTYGERQATLRMLLQARSGVYYSYVGGSPHMRELMPEREAHPPGAFWSYNNWDFNVLGGVYERKLNRKIEEAFQAEIAAPLQMQDFQLTICTI
jgi:CubicO group peptidase (beta-lactamase class C family)